MDNLFWLNWSPEQFTEFESRCVSVPLELLVALATAAELLGEGRRPDKKGRENWATTSLQAQTLLAPHILAITQ